jgi:phosphate/phosphite/phosphonate ABC transporter binding protein
VGDAKTTREMADPRKLCVGIALTTDPNTAQMLLEELCDALAEATGLEVVPRGVWHYHHLIEGLDDGQIDIVWLPPILAVRATTAGRVVPLALPVRNGVSSYRAALFSKAGSSIKAIGDLHGLRAAWVDRQSAAGYLIIRAHLETQGVDLGKAFRQEVFVGTHDGVAGAVMDDEADVGATYAYLDEAHPDGDVVLRAGWGRAAAHVVAYSAPIPSDIIAADRAVPDEVRLLVQRALVQGGNARLEQSARMLLSADGFIAPTEQHLQPLATLLAGMQKNSNAAHSLFPPPGSNAPEGRRSGSPSPPTTPPSDPGDAGDPAK